MALSRRFLGLIVQNRDPAVKSLFYIDLMRQRFFNPEPTGQESEQEPQAAATSRSPAGSRKNKHGPAPAAAAKSMETLRLPGKSYTLRAGTAGVDGKRKIHCFPLADGKVICADPSGDAFLVDASKDFTGTMPRLHRPKSSPVSVFVPGPDPGDDPDDYDGEGGGNLYVMERAPVPEPEAQESDQFEAFVYGKPTTSTSYSKSWDCQRLPPPPYAREAWDSGRRCPEITSYAVVGGGSHVCVSADGAGTYCLDTASHTWNQVGRWTLPFSGKVEYVPELKLWFGLYGAEGAQRLAAADLSAMDSPPQLVDAWKELDAPEEWRECHGCQFVSLGSGSFCVARFFQDTSGSPNLGEQDFAVLTGVQVVPRVHDDEHAGDDDDDGGGNGKPGKVGHRMVKHNSRRLDNLDGATIAAMF